MSDNIYELYNIDKSKLKRDYLENPLKMVPRNRCGGTIKEIPHKEDLEYLYVKKELPTSILLKFFNIGKTTFKKWLKYYEIKRSKSISSKLREITCLKRYGVKHNSQIDIVKYNNIKKNQELHGVDYYFQSDDFKEKSVETLKANHNVEHNSQIKSVQESIKRTNKEKFGNKIFSRTNHFRDYFGLEHISDDIWKIFESKETVEDYIIKNNIETIEQMSIKLNLSKSFINKYINQYELRKYIKYSSSYPEKCWLDSLNIQNNYRQYKIGKYIVDGYDPNSNTVYEFYGDYWHGNPNIYNKNDMNKKLV